jgi:hypothetical protein
MQMLSQYIPKHPPRNAPCMLYNTTHVPHDESKGSALAAQSQACTACNVKQACWATAAAWRWFSAQTFHANSKHGMNLFKTAYHSSHAAPRSGQVATHNAQMEITKLLAEHLNLC